MRCVKQYWPAFFVLAGCSFKPIEEHTTDAGVVADTITDDCTPMMTACDGRVVKTCGDDRHWNPSLDRQCDFTCDHGACVGTSNVPLADVATCDSNAPLLAPPAGAVVSISASGGTHLDCSPNCGTPGVTRIDAVKKYAAPAPGLSLFCLSKISLTGATQLGVAGGGGPSEAIAFVVDDTVDIASIVSLDGGAAGSGSSGGHGGPGGYDGAALSSGGGGDGKGPCHGKGGSNDGPAVFGDDWSGGGGGGAGNATVGGFGGNGSCVDGDHHGQGGDDGGVCGNATLVPLVGGSGGGGGGDATINGPYGYAGGGGGGALQISARRSITISGAVSARGGAGYGTSSVDGGGGGGAGGGFLFEAPMIAITGQLIVDGGNGGISGSGPGGVGASGGSIAASGLSYAANGQGGGGGGGGGGRIRIVGGGNATCTSGVSPNTSCSTSVLVAVP
ncbi:MAG: hypothetical protein ABJE66_26780 [Deltaproteobacteria bacterium]